MFVGCFETCITCCNYLWFLCAWGELIRFVIAWREGGGAEKIAELWFVIPQQKFDEKKRCD